jgi:dTDP-4-dehydrorhamnose reductase
MPLLKEDRVLIFGDGQIGNFYLDHFREIGVEAKIARDVDITKPDQVAGEMDEYRPSVVINTAAKTNLEYCAKNRLDTFETNTLGADVVAKACDERGIYNIFFSSACIYESKDENDLKTEKDSPKPGAYYSWTKVWAENLLGFEKSDNFKNLIIRPRQPISAKVHHKNTILKMLTFTKAIDTPNTITVLEDLMEWTDVFIEKRITGAVNCANPGWTTPYRICSLLKDKLLPDMELTKITKEELDKITPNRRVDVVLDVTHLETIVGKVKSCDERMPLLIDEFVNNFKNDNQESVKEQVATTIEQTKQRAPTNKAIEELLETL